MVCTRLVINYVGENCTIWRLDNDKFRNHTHERESSNICKTRKNWLLMTPIFALSDMFFVPVPISSRPGQRERIRRYRKSNLSTPPNTETVAFETRVRGGWIVRPPTRTSNFVTRPPVSDSAFRFRKPRAGCREELCTPYVRTSSRHRENRYIRVCTYETQTQTQTGRLLELKYRRVCTKLIPSLVRSRSRRDHRFWFGSRLPVDRYRRRRRPPITGCPNPSGVTPGLRTHS